MKKIKKKKLIAAIMILVFLIICVVTYLKTYSEYVSNPNNHGSGVVGGVVYVNDSASDYYFYTGMNYVGDIYSNTVNYNDTNLKAVTINYYGYQNGVTTCDNDDYDNCGYVSLTEKQYQFVYYKYFPIENGYINIDLIDNPFTLRPTDKGFGGWTSSAGTITENTKTHEETLRVPVTSGNMIVDVYANWVTANVVYLKGYDGDDNFDGRTDFNAVGSWSKAFELLRTRSTDQNNREINIIVLTGNMDHGINYTRSITHTWNTNVTYHDGTTFGSAEVILGYVNGNRRYAVVDDDGSINTVELLTNAEPARNTKWYISSVTGGYTIQNYYTGKYLVYTRMGDNIDLAISTTPTVWKYDSTGRKFYETFEFREILRDFTVGNTFTSGNSYVVGSSETSFNTISSDLGNVEINPLTRNNIDVTGLDWRITGTGNSYSFFNTTTNRYLDAIDNGDQTVSLGLSNTSSNWTYDTNNSTLSKTVSVDDVVRSYTVTTSFAEGVYSLTTSNVSNNIPVLAVSRNGNQYVTTTTNLTTSASPDASALWTIAIYDTNRYTICNSNGSYLRYDGTLTTTRGANTAWSMDNNGRIRARRNNGASYNYLVYNSGNGTWSVTATQNNGSIIYFVQESFEHHYSDVDVFLNFNGTNWMVTDDSTEATSVSFATYNTYEDITNRNFYLRYNNGFTISNSNTNNSLNFIDYEISRNYTNTTQGNIGTNSNYNGTNNVAVTITSLYNGIDYRDDATLTLTNATNAQNAFQIYKDIQLENLRVSSRGFDAIDNDGTSTNYATGTYNTTYPYLAGNYHNVRIGRGMIPDSWTGNVDTIFGFMYGASSSSSMNTGQNEYRFVVETGRYSGLMAGRIANDGNYSSTNRINYSGTMRLVVGNDYDRATGDNEHLAFYYRIGSHNNYGTFGSSDVNNPAYLMRIKSGNIGYDYFKNNPTDDERAYSGIYVGGLTVSASSTTTDLSNRVLIVEGGKIANIIGGLRLPSGSTVKTKIYVKGGLIVNTVGGAGVSTTYGDRYTSITGGQIEYSVAGGSNGVLATSGSSQTGEIDGDSYIHVGGNAEIGTIGSGELYGVSYGSVLGAGNGNASVSRSGQVDVTHVYLSGDAKINGSVYGGGNYGSVIDSVVMQIDGATVMGSVYGGPNQNDVGNVTVTRRDTTLVTYEDNTTFSVNDYYLITKINDTTRNALTAGGTGITNTVTSNTTSPNNNTNWLINSSNGGYTILNRNTNTYLSTIGNSNSATLTMNNDANNSIWQYDSNNRSFHRIQRLEYTDVSYTFSTSFTSDERYLITNGNTNTSYALNGNGGVSRQALSTSTAPSETMEWIIRASGNGYTIQNASTSNYLGNNNTNLRLSSTPTVWTYDATNRRFSIGISNWFFNTTYYLCYNNGTWSLNTNTDGSTVYFATYNATNTFQTSDYYLAYNNGWTLTTTNTGVNQLSFTKYSSTVDTTFTATNKSNGNVTIKMTGGEIKNTLYGGSCLNGDVAGLVDIEVSGGKIGYSTEHSGSVFGGGYGASTTVASGVNLKINDLENDVDILGTTYGGSALGSVIGDVSVTIKDDTVRDETVDIAGDMYCGSMGDINQPTTGMITGNCNISVLGGTYPGSLFGGNNSSGTAKGAITVTTGGSGITTDIKNVYGGGNEADSYATSVTVYAKNDSDIDNLFGGGNLAKVNVTNVYLQGGIIDNAFGGSNRADATTTNVYLDGSSVGSLYGGSNQEGEVLTTNISATSGSCTTIYGGNNLGGSTGTTNINVNGSTVTTCYGGGNLAENNTSNISINTGNVGTLFGGGNEAITNQTFIDLNGGSVTTCYGGGNQAGITTSTSIDLIGSTCGSIYGGSNASGIVPVTNINATGGRATTIYGGNNLGGSTTASNVIIDGSTVTTCYGGGREAITGTTVVSLNSGNVTTCYGGGESADVTNSTTITLDGSNVETIYGGSNRLGTVPNSHITTSSGSVNTIYGGNNAGGTTTTTHILVDGGLVTDIYGGGNEAVTTTSNITIDDANNRISNIYGGGNQASVTTTNIDVNNSSDVGNVYGGSNKLGTVSKSNVTINDSTDALVVYGGNNAGGTTVDSNVSILGGTVGYVYGGGNEAVTTKTNVYVNDATITNDLYGGGNQAGITDDVKLKINFSSVDNIYGGGNLGTVGGNTNVNVVDATVSGSIYAGGNGSTATVMGSTLLNVGGDTTVTHHVFGGGNAAMTGTELEDSSNSMLNISGGIIGGNVYGGANTSVLYGETTVNIGLDAILENAGTVVDVTYNNGLYKTNEATMTLNNNFINTTGDYWNNFVTIKNDLTTTITDYTLVMYTGDNEITECYNCFYHTENGYTTFTPRTDWSFSLNGNDSYSLQGSWNIVDASQIYVDSYYTSNITDPIRTSDFPKSDIDIAGTVFGGGEANASGSDNYDYSFISVTKGIDINIDANDYDNFDIHGSIFGSGNASSSGGYSYIDIKNYGTETDYKSNVSIQRANIVTLDNSAVELLGATDRTNEYSNVLFSISRVDHMKLKNNSTLYLDTGTNLLKEFSSLVDVNGEEVLETVDIDNEEGIFDKNVSNQLFVWEGKNINIATNQNITAYGRVNGMTFFGMFKHDRSGKIVTAMYDDNYETGDSITSSDLVYFSGGSYVLGFHETNHDITKNGFYTIFDDEENPGIAKKDYITPTPPDAGYYMWAIGVVVTSYEIDMIASKYSTLGTYELPLVNFSEPNTMFNVLGFTFNELDSDVNFGFADSISRIASSSEIADNNMGLVMESSNTGWMNSGSTTFLTDDTTETPFSGTRTYRSENSTTVPSLLFYLYHSKNLGTSADMGKVTVSLQVITPIDDLNSDVERLDIVINLSRVLYNTNDYEGAITSGRKYEMFANTATSITSKSSISTYYSLFVDSASNFYRNGYFHTLTSNYLFPENTKITMIDYHDSSNPEYYYYVVNSRDLVEDTLEFNDLGEVSYPLSRFIRMGSDSPGNHYDDAIMNSLYYDSSTGYAEEEFIFIVDFSDSNITTSQMGVSLLIELRNSDDQVLVGVLGVQQSAMLYNIYADADATILVDASLSSNTIYVGKTTRLDVTTTFTQQSVAGSIVYDTNYFDKKSGLKISLKDSNGNTVNGYDLLGVNLVYDGVSYYPRTDGSYRISISDKVANVLARITIDTTNSNLASGDYTIYVESFGSPDGIYYGLVSSDVSTINLKVVNAIYGLDVNLNENYMTIDKETGINLGGTNQIKATINYSSGLSNPNLRVSLYRRKYDSIYETNYELVDLQDYVSTSLTSTNLNDVYLIVNNPTSTMSYYLDFKENLMTGTYRLTFSLYDNNNYIGDIYKYIFIK